LFFSEQKFSPHSINKKERDQDKGDDDQDLDFGSDDREDLEKPLGKAFQELTDS